MVQSMTGFAAASAESPFGTLVIELRSVNSRFLDLQLRVAEELRSAEPLLRETIAARVARGKVDCRLTRTSAAAQPQQLNESALRELRALAAGAAAAFPGAAPLRVADVLRWPGVLAEPEPDAQRMRAILEDLCRRALDELCSARAREGGRLAAALRERAAEMRRRIAGVAPLVPEAVAAYRARLAERLREAMAEGIEERIRAEVALFAAKSDVDEEITRLGAHLDEVERALAGAAGAGPVGKRLDFLAQELNREANTLASKAAGLKIADCAMELKLLIEQIREQVQNIE
ncbi:MAG: YicC family protein [Burkholderiales bacterium]|nr:YicC family protein [Burkholderiales bacterium]